MCTSSHESRVEAANEAAIMNIASVPTDIVSTPHSYVSSSNTGIIYYTTSSGSTETWYTCNSNTTTSRIIIDNSNYRIYGRPSTAYTSTGYTAFYNSGNSYSIGGTSSVYTPTKIDHRKIRTKRDNTRKALWKSIRLYDSLFGMDDIKVFLDGGSFIIEGELFDYRISRKTSTNLLDHTGNPGSMFIPYLLEWLNKDAEVLFQGCTVFRNTPVIDQITALALHIKSDEEYVLRNTNISMLTSEFYIDNTSLEIVNRVKDKTYSITNQSSSSLLCTPTWRTRIDDQLISQAALAA